MDSDTGKNELVPAQLISSHPSLAYSHSKLLFYKNIIKKVTTDEIDRMIKKAYNHSNWIHSNPYFMSPQ